MEKFVYLNCLYDLYGDLLTKKQQEYFTSYYFDNLSYGEIGDKYHVTRNAVYHQLKLIEEKLLFYEEKLKLYSKKQTINDIIDMIEDKKIKRIIENLF